jgi:hypothetical protein
MKLKIAFSLMSSLALGAVGVVPTAAAAQMVGTYTGTSADGQNISITIGTDSSTGLLQVQGWNYGIASTCTGGTTFNTGWGFGPDGTGTDLNGATGTYKNSFSYVYVTSTFRFVRNEIIGTLASYTPTFAPVASGRPTKAIFCTSKNQKFTATFVETATVAAATIVQPTALSYGGTLAKTK